MTTDPYMDAINAGAAALAKPYRDPDTISAFVETFPTIAAARVIDAALQHLRATILAEAIPPGPCPETSEFWHQGPYIEGHPDPNTLRTIRALCDLRAGHVGQHEADDPNFGTYRWTRTATPYAEQWPELASRCAVEHGSRPGVVCWKQPGHADAHDNGAYMWNDCGEDIKPDTQCGNRAQRTPTDLRVCELTSGHDGYHIDGRAGWDSLGGWISHD